MSESPPFNVINCKLYNYCVSCVYIVSGMPCRVLAIDAADIPAEMHSLFCTAAMKTINFYNGSDKSLVWVNGGQKEQDGLCNDFWYKRVSCNAV